MAVRDKGEMGTAGEALSIFAPLKNAGHRLPLTRSLAGAQESTLHLVLRLRGGAKKRKKKNYTTPKKIKHKHKKVKLATLKYYKVDAAGKITRLRKVCPDPNCGPGTFMASHFDRQYCGKCGLTYMFEGAAKMAPPPPKPKVEAEEAPKAAAKGKKK